MFWIRLVNCMENTYLCRTSLPLLYLFLCWGKKTFSPLPRSISAFISYRQLIDKFFTFLSFLPAGTLMYIRLLMYPVQMPSLMFLILLRSRAGNSLIGFPSDSLKKMSDSLIRSFLVSDLSNSLTIAHFL